MILSLFSINKQAIQDTWKSCLEKIYTVFLLILFFQELKIYRNNSTDFEQIAEIVQRMNLWPESRGLNIKNTYEKILY